MQKLNLTAFIALLLASASSCQNHTETCQDNMWPILAGGSSNEKVNCIAYYPETDFIIIGGNTTSPDFGPTSDSHGFLYALDNEGNFKWGNVYYNTSHRIEDITGCQLSTNGSSLSVMAKAKSMPVAMEINPFTGSVDNFISIGFFTDYGDSLNYETNGALLFDN